jgi:hypothetical protein
MTPTTCPGSPRRPILLLAALSAILLTEAIPDLFAGQPRVAHGRYPTLHEAVGDLAMCSLGDLETAAPPAIPFLQVLLVEENGARRTIGTEGEAWLADTLTRRLVRTLPEEKLTRLRAALRAADVEHWAAGDAILARGRARLIVVLSGGQTRSIALAAALADPPTLALVALVRGATS